MKLDFRPAQPEDIEPLFAFNRELIDAYEDKSLIDYGRVLAWVRRKLEQRLDEYTCVWAGGQKAGYFHFYPLDGKVMELDDLYLFPAFRGRGIGTEIIRACCRSRVNCPSIPSASRRTESRSSIRPVNRPSASPASTLTPPKSCLRYSARATSN